MKSGLRFASLLLAVLFIVPLLPAKALADELSPYEFVETPEDGVVLYHNKDGSYTMAVGATDVGTGAGGATTTYRYDAVGNLTSVTDPLGRK